MVCQLVFLLPVGLHRLIARDEGFYLLAAKLVSEGKRLYHDFFYPQMPFLPWVYGPWLSLAGMQWNHARLLATLLTAAIGALLCLRAARLFGNVYAAVGLLLFCASVPVFSVYTTVTTYSLSTLFLFAAYVILCSQTKKGIKYLWAGLIYAMAINTRLMFAGVFPAFLLYILFEERPVQTGAAVLKFCSGLALGLSVNLYFLWPSLDVFYFNNLGYHLQRSSAGLAQTMEHRRQVLGLLCGWVRGVKFESVQFPILIWSAITALLVRFFSGSRIDAAHYIWSFLFAVNFLPKPVYVQYFSTLVPFLTIGVLDFSHMLFASKSGMVKGLAAAAACLGIWIYLKNVNQDVIKYTVTGRGVIGIMRPQNALDWNIERVREISRIINGIAPPDEPVFSYWPGYLIETSAQPLPGSENQFGIITADNLTEHLRRKYSVISNTETLAALRAGLPGLVLIHQRLSPTGFRQALREGGYGLIKSLDAVEIYARFQPSCAPEVDEVGVQNRAS